MTTTSPSAAPLLWVHRLTFARADERVFGPLDFALHAGETVLVEGDNGSGKTTLLRVLAGMLQATSGEIRIAGQRASRETRNGRVLWLGHRGGMHAALSARENLAFLAGLYGVHPGATPATAMERVGIGAWLDEPLHALSAGQKKRVALARLLLLPGELWLLDEPYANLDRRGIDLVNALIAQHCAARGAALVTSHGAVRFAGSGARLIALAA